MTVRPRILAPTVLGALALAALGALATVPTAPRPADAQARIEQPTLEIAAVRDPQLGSQVAVADALGLFKDAGLNVTVRWQQSAADVITLMAGGNQNIGTGGTFAQIVLGGQRLPVKTIAALADIAGTQGFVLSPGVKLAHPRELEGKKLAFTQGNSQVLILAKLAKLYGFDQAKVTLVNMQPSEGVVAASKGDVQGLLGWQPNLFRLVKLGGTMYTTGTVSFIGGKAEPFPANDRLQFNHSVLMVSDTWIREKPNTLKAVLQALMRANDVIVRERAKALDVLVSQLRIDRDAIEVMVDANSYGLAITDDVANSIRFQSDWALQIKRIPNPVSPEDVFAPKLLAEIDPKLVTWKPRP
ncbi:MAG TPA: ABC transporter substrate-binding protein [Candidatus Bathyarchaeia archaeon]|nr:ABC transporter substrate-binding protein [Candidatus Bathyarchaeia archaeon]